MKDSGSASRERWTISPPTRHFEKSIQYLLTSEPRILQSISARESVPQILNEICNALNFEVPNIVSLITLRELDRANTVDATRSAALFGLHIFFSAGIVAENGETLGSMEMYCCYDRCEPSPRELQIIERAACLAAIAVERGMGARPVDRCVPDDRRARRRVFEWPSLN